MGQFFDYKLYLLMNQSGDIFSTALLNRYATNIKMDENLAEGLKVKNYAE